MFEYTQGGGPSTHQVFNERFSIVCEENDSAILENFNEQNTRKHTNSEQIGILREEHTAVAAGGRYTSQRQGRHADYVTFSKKNYCSGGGSVGENVLGSRSAHDSCVYWSFSG